MKTFSTLIFTILAASCIFFGFTKNDPDTKSGPVSNPDLIVKFYENMHRPYGAVLPQNIQEMILQAVRNVPEENSSGPDAVNSWNLKGPIGMNLAAHPGSYYSGRILDIETDNGVGTRIASASGGLWGFTFIFPVPLSDQINSLVVSTFDSKPGDANTIFMGTGESGIRAGTGLWKTSNAGATWTKVILSPDPAFYYRLRYDPENSNIIHFSSSEGYYQSTNGGAFFTRYLAGNITDIAVNPSNNQIMYASKWGDGIYKSVNGGANWTKLTGGIIPTTNVGRVSISIAASSPNTVYFNIGKNDLNTSLGIFKTTDGGISFTNILSTDILGGQGWYGNAIGVSPTNPNLLIAGGVNLVRSSNGGATWNFYFTNTDPLYEVYNLHADIHDVTWSSDGAGVYVGSDGGMSYSVNAGLNWSTSANYLPITQYVNFDIGGSGSHIIGGSQDNGISGTTNGGSGWWLWQFGDGGGVAIDPSSPGTFAVTNGVYNGNLAFRRLLTTNEGSTWSDINTGFDPSSNWYTKIRNDKISPVYLYSNSGPYIYESQNYGLSWNKLNVSPFPADVYNLNVSRYSAPLAIIYACINSATNGQRLRVYEGNVWFERSTGFPSGVQVQTVAQHPSDNNVAYALMNGYGSPQKVFKTTNRGVSWTNITGDLPNISVTDLIPHPTNNNVLFLGSEFGCYKTINGGANWIKWNNGMPQASIITEMNAIDSIATNGKYYIVAGTYGRGFWTREIQGFDPIGIHNGSTDVISFELKQNYPNPFNPSTEIRFALPSSDFVTLKVYDITGKEIRTLLNEKMNQGIHSVNFNGSGLSSGVYFYRISSGKFTDVKKMILVK